jgi:hypothetical protein
VIVVVDSGSARSTALLAVRERLENLGTRVFGVVLNWVHGAKRSYVRSHYGSSTLADSRRTDRAAERLPVTRSLD